MISWVGSHTQKPIIVKRFQVYELKLVYVRVYLKRLALQTGLWTEVGKRGKDSLVFVFLIKGKNSHSRGNKTYKTEKG